MRSKLLFLMLLGCFIIEAGYTQITGPATATAGVPTTFYGPPGLRSYTWNRIPLQIDMNGNIARNLVSTISGAQDVHVLYDQGQWFAFNFSWNAPLELRRISLGADPTQPPASTGTPIITYTNNDRPYGMTFYHDSTTGNWHCFMAMSCNTGCNRLKIRRLDFTSLSAMPTETTFTIPAAISNLDANAMYEIILIKEDGEYMLFLSNYWGAPYRIDLGTSVANSTPTAGVRLNTSPGGNATGMAFHKQDGVWHALQVGINNNLMRYTFTNGIKDPSPTISNVGSNLLTIPGGVDKYRIRLIAGDCGDQLLGFVAGGNNIFRLNFNGDITSTPGTPVAICAQNFNGALTQGLYPYIYNNKLYLMTGSFNDNGLFNIELSDLPPATLQHYNQPEVSLTFPAPGTYDVHLVTDMEGIGPTNAWCHTVSVVTGSVLPPGPFVNPADTVCAGAGSISYEVPAMTGIDSYLWDYTGTGVTINGAAVFPVSTSPANNGHQVAVDFSASATSGTLRVRVTDGSDTSVFTTVAVRVMPVPSMQLGANPEVCAGNMSALLPFTNVLPVNVQYNIDWNAAATSAGFTGVANTPLPASPVSVPVPPTAPADIYEGGLTIYTSHPGCVSAPYPFRITIHALPPVALIPTAAQTLCDGDSVLLTTTAGGNLQYQWKRNGALVGGDSNTYYASVSGSYAVEVTNTTTACMTVSTPPVAITVHPRPVVTMTPAGSVALCENDSITLTVAPPAANNYSWQHNGITLPVSGNIHTVSTAGVYQVTVTDHNNCIGKSDTVVVAVHKRPEVSLTTGDTAFCQGASVFLYASLQDTLLDYSWLDGNTLIPFAPAYFIEIDASGVYRSIVSLRNMPHCADTSQPVAVTVYDLPEPEVTWDGQQLRASSGFGSYQWYVNAQPASGATDSVFRALETGVYRVAVTDSNNCTGISDPVYIDRLDVHEAYAMPDIRIYPNPVSELLYIRSEGGIRVVLTGMDGRMVLAADDISAVDMRDYADGVYLLEVTNKEGTRLYYEKIVKQ